MRYIGKITMSLAASPYYEGEYELRIQCERGRVAFRRDK